VRAVHFNVAVRADEQYSRRPRLRARCEHVERALVGVVQVLEDDAQRRHIRGVAEECRDRLEETEALLLRAARRRQVHLDLVPDLRDDAGHFGGAGPELLDEFVRVVPRHCGVRIASTNGR
jgi:uncharacterized protein (UPF0147 family)